MSFTRVNPLGWAPGDEFLSSQANQMDANISFALDKSTAGDVLSGVITMASTAAIDISNAGAQINAAVLDAVIVTASKGINSGATNGISAAVPSGISAAVAGGISDGGNAGGLATTTAGGLKLGGGSTDWPTFSATRSRTNTSRILNPRSLASGWTVNTGFGCQCLVGPATSQQQFIPLDFLHDGATLQAILFTFLVPNSHASVPQNLPQFNVFSFNAGIIGSPSFLTATSLGGGYQGPNPADYTGSSWYNSGANQQFEYVCNAGVVIDAVAHAYVVSITDENGTNSQSGNCYLFAQPFYTSIPNMAWA